MYRSKCANLLTLILHQCLSTNTPLPFSSSQVDLRPGLRLPPPTLSIRIRRQCRLDSRLRLIYELLLSVAASGFPLDVLGRLSVGQAAEGDVVEVDGATD